MPSPTITKYNFYPLTGGEKLSIVGNAETIVDGSFAAAPDVLTVAGTLTTLSDGSVVKVTGSGASGFLTDTLGANVTSVTDTSSHNDVFYGNGKGDTYTLSGTG